MVLIPEILKYEGGPKGAIEQILVRKDSIRLEQCTKITIEQTDRLVSLLPQVYKQLLPRIITSRIKLEAYVTTGQAFEITKSHTATAQCYRIQKGLTLSLHRFQ